MGRKSKEEEAADYLTSLGLDPEEVFAEAQLDDQGRVDKLKEVVYDQAVDGKLQGASLVAALKALAALADASKGDQKDDTPERRIDEVIADAGLPAERRREIAEREIERLESAAAALKIVLGGIE